MSTDEIVRLVNESKCPVVVAVRALHAPEAPPEGMQWLSGGNAPHCLACSTGDPYLDALWPCETLKAVAEALDAVRH